MKAIAKIKPEKGLEYIEIEKPETGKNQVLIKVEVAAICGTDIHWNRWDQNAKDFAHKFNINYPLVIGHEISGVIEKIGEEVKGRKIGQRVAIETHIPCGNCYNCQNNMEYNCQNMKLFATTCNGGFSDYAVIEENATFILPDEISFEEGALLEPAGCAMRAIEEAKVKQSDTVVIIGCGPIGLIAIQILKAMGIRVIAINRSEYRLNMAKKIGAITISNRENVIEKVLELTKDHGGADVIIELSGNKGVYEYIFDILRIEGRIVTVGNVGGEVPINITKNINIKGATIKGIFGRKMWSTWWNVTSLIKEKKINLSEIITHRYRMSDYKEAFKQSEKESGKILLINEGEKI